MSFRDRQADARFTIEDPGGVAKSARAAATGHEGDAERLHEYWTRGKGLARWISSPHPWSKLYHLLLRHMGNPEVAKRTASQWYHDATGHWVGEAKGKNPVGRG